jgi:hypothetical protein
MFIVQLDANLQCRLLFDEPFHPQGLLRTSKIRFPAPFASALPDDPTAPRAELRTNPWRAQMSFPVSPLLQLTSPPGGSHLLRTCCCAELQLLEPFLLRQQRWGEDGGG